MANPAYLDYNATAPLLGIVREAMEAVWESPANASSVHGFGQRAAAILENAREQIAHAVGAQPERIVFTSGGTEANAMILRGRAGEATALSAIEHVAVLENAPAGAVRIPVDGDGVIDLTALEDWLKAAPTGSLIAVMAANNETGTLQPIARIAALAQQYGAAFHCDAVQALGKIPLDFTALAEAGMTSMALSAHKIGGAQGVGALLLADGAGAGLRPLMHGGGQERGRRPGTENLAGIAGFGAAAAAIDVAAFESRCRPLQKRLEARIAESAPDAVIFGRNAERLPNTSAIAMPSMPAETQVMAFDLAGFAVSAGAACSSGKVAASHVLAAMLKPGEAGEAAGRAIRVSTGMATTEAEIDGLAAAWLRLYKQGAKQKN